MKLFKIFFLILILNIDAFAEDNLLLSGRFSVRGINDLHKNSVREDPNAYVRLKIKAKKISWLINSWIEAGWDGTVRDPSDDNFIIKKYNEIYQDNKPYLEFKELYIEKAISEIDFKIGIQRFSWGRLDEYPANDLLNTWDYTRFLTKSLEDRKIGTPSISAAINRDEWQFQTVFIPYFIPYRLPKSNERWAGSSKFKESNIPVINEEPELPSRNIENSNIAFRLQKNGEIEFAATLFHGFDPRPVMKSTYLKISQKEIYPGYMPSFNKITTFGIDASAVKGDFSLRAEAAYTFKRHLNIRQELWGYPNLLFPGVFRLNKIEKETDTLDYGIGADYRLFEDCFLIMQAQQTLIFDRDDTFFDKQFETTLWMSIKTNWMNQKLETNLNTAYNPEHHSLMIKASGYYIFNDYIKAGISAIFFDGTNQSIFGRYSTNDQIEAELICSW